MNTNRSRLTHGHCENCNSRVDGEIINIISTYKYDLILCDDCMKGMSIMLTKTTNDKKEHYYCSTNKTCY